MTTAKQHHIMIGDTPWCEWSGSMAGMVINRKAGMVTCGHTSGAAARRAAQALRPHFEHGSVKVVSGACSHG